MELIERDESLSSLHSGFKKIASGEEGHCFFIIGEPGIGKTSLVKTFLSEVGNDCLKYMVACDSLFTPPLLAPLYDLAFQMKKDWANKIASVSSRAELFSMFMEELGNKERPVVLVLEDIHWADEATIDFVKFFARRISRMKCLFIITCRDDEVSQQNALRIILGDLSHDTFSRIQLIPLSRQAVYQLADEKGFDAGDVYSISGGNPFYVNEILASYSPGVPENIKDAILSVYNQQEEAVKKVLQILSVIPEGLEVNRFAIIKVSGDKAMDHCFALKILVLKNDKIIFKHELYRRTIESSLSPLKRISLNKKLLDLLLSAFEEAGEIERIVHYAKNANEKKLVVKYAPLAARKAASVGAHRQAAKLCLTAIEYSEGNDMNQLVELYEAYAYECYLTSKIADAIIYQEKVLSFWQKKNELEKTGNSLRFLSRLWWFEGNYDKAMSFGKQAIEMLCNQPSSKAKAMAYSNMSNLKMTLNLSDECIFWGEKAIAIARELNDEEIIAYNLSVMGTSLMVQEPSMQKGLELLQESLDIALKNSYPERIAYAYNEMGSNGVTIKDYPFAKKMLDEGIRYCEENDIYSLKLYMLKWKARAHLETGNWNEAYQLAEMLVKNQTVLPVIKIGALTVIGTIMIRRGDANALPLLLEAKAMALATGELLRIVPVFMALLEYEWITGKIFIEPEILDHTISDFTRSANFSKNSRFYFWLRKARKEHLQAKGSYNGYDVSNATIAKEEALLWEKLGCPYEQAIILSEGNDDDKRRALSTLKQLGADAVCDKIKMEMRASGIKSIPRGLRESTMKNPAKLTNRELDVLQLLQQSVHNKEIAETLFISAKTVDHHISSILFKLDVKSRGKAVNEALRLGILK